jgi:Lon-like ATP-dependent protease
LIDDRKLTNVTQNIKEGLEGRPARWYSDVLDLVFPNVDKDQASKCKACEIADKEKAKKKAAKSKDSSAEDSD